MTSPSENPSGLGPASEASAEERCTRLEQQVQELLTLSRDLATDNRLLKDRLNEVLFSSKKRERWSPDQEALPFDDVAEATGEAKIAAVQDSKPETDLPSAKQAEKPKRKKHPGRTALSPLLPRRDVRHEMSKDCLDEKYGQGNWKVIGEEASEVLDSEPSSLFVIRDIRVRYGSVDAAKPPVVATSNRVIAKGKAGSGLIARIISAKFDDALPLYRQETIFKREGARINRSSMVGWLQRAAKLLEPASLAILDKILAGGIVEADEKPITVLDRGHGKGWFKGYLCGYGGKDDDFYFDFRESRSRDGPMEILKSFKGVVQRDAYVVYDSIVKELHGILSALCWAHTRRPFFQCRNEYPAECSVALGLIRQLYVIESELKQSNASPAEILAVRKAKSAPIIDVFEEFINQDHPASTPGNALGKALQYARNCMHGLRTYLDYPELSPDTNRIERCTKHAAILRKNFLFFGSPNGGRYGAVLLTLALNCRMLGIDTWKYMKWALEAAASDNSPDPAQMTPRAWRDAQA